MTILDSGINRIRDLVSADMAKGQLGTDGTASAITDTGLIAADATTLLDITKTLADKAIKIDYTLPSTGGTTGTYKEFAVSKVTSPATVFIRTVFTGTPWTANGSEELNISQILYFEQG